MARAAVQEITPEGESINDLVAKHDFSVISFFHEQDENVKKVDGLLEGAQAFMEKQIADGSWTKRDIGWYRVNFEKYPELAADDSGIADQLVYNNSNGLQRFIHFMAEGEDQAESERDMAEVVKELTGDWFEEIKCDEIQSDERIFYDEVVYFGDAADLKGEEYGALLESMSMVDRYQYDHHRVGFYYNADPACREETDLDPEKK